MSAKDEFQEMTDAAHESIEVSEDGTHARLSVPGATGHHAPGERTAVARDALSDERLDLVDTVTAAVPLGDTEVLDEVRRQLHSDATRAAGATVMVEGSKHTEE